METKFLAQSKSPWLHPFHHVHKNKLTTMASPQAMLTKPVGNGAGATVTSHSSLATKPADATQVKLSTVYHDNWFDKMAINYLSQTVQAVSGLKNEKSGYESLVESATQVAKKFSPIQQQQLVIRALDSAFPKPILTLIRTIIPESQFAREYFAAFTALFFVWLIGPCEVKESEINGAREKNVTHIKKCRFLEQSNCVGMCINMCKIPSQTFIKDSFGISVNMVPNFDDMSCEMIFGQEPPEPNNDPALSQPCYKLCKAKQRHTVNCTK